MCVVGYETANTYRDYVEDSFISVVFCDSNRFTILFKFSGDCCENTVFACDCDVKVVGCFVWSISASSVYRVAVY